MKRGLFVFFALWIVMNAGFATAQSPYAGSWSGTYAFTSTSTCTTTGFGTTSVNCTGTYPWFGSVDSQGTFTITSSGAGTGMCSDGTPQSFPADTNPADAYSLGTISGNGAIQVPAYTQPIPDTLGTTTETCGAYTIQFSGGKVSGGSSCAISVSDNNGGGVTTTCAQTYSETYSGAQGASSVVLAPPKVVFPITVSSNITSTSATATAQVSPPSTLAGTQGSVFVFAHVRQSALTPHADKRASLAPLAQKDGGSPDPCVLAQLNSSGQLTATSASSMQAYTTGVLSAQSQSVTVLNNVPTSNVAGATLLVGYGANSSTMISSGNFEGAVSVTGSSQCNAALLAGAAPNSPGGLTGLWWNQNENGWGISFTQRRNIVFGAWYTYDASGNPKWYVATDCEMPAGVTGTNGTCSGKLYQVTGPTFFGATFNPNLDNVVSVGNLTVAFQDGNTAMMTYTVNGQGRTVALTRQLFQSGTTPPAIDYSDLWWNPNESGWGMSITQQYGVMFLAWYVYDSSGNPVWYVATDCVVQGSSCTGSVYSTTGPPLGPTFIGPVSVSTVGTITANFVDANNATITYTVNGVSSTKQITRQTF